MNHLKTRKGRGVRAVRERCGRWALGLALILAGAGCKTSVPTDRRIGPTGADLSTVDDAAADDDDDDDDAECEDGATRYCKITLATHGKVTSCFEGVRICKDGAWGSCTDPPATSTP